MEVADGLSHLQPVERERERVLNYTSIQTLCTNFTYVLLNLLFGSTISRGITAAPVVTYYLQDLCYYTHAEGWIYYQMYSVIKKMPRPVSS